MASSSDRRERTITWNLPKIGDIQLHLVRRLKTFWFFTFRTKRSGALRAEEWRQRDLSP
jgi:hypothetical protein